MTRAREGRTLWQAMALGLMFAFITGCASPKPEMYRPNPPDPQVRNTGYRIAVVEFSDWGYADHEQRLFLFKKSTGFGRCLASELTAGGQFEKVDYFSDWAELESRHNDYHLIVTGRQLFDIMHYGVNWPFVIPPLSFLPLLAAPIPMDWADRSFAFDVSVLLANKPLTPIFQKQIRQDSAGTLYGYMYAPHNLLKEDALSPCPTELLQPGFLDFRRSLTQALISGATSSVTKDKAVIGASMPKGAH